MSKIIIEVNRGMIQAIYSEDIGEHDIYVIDYDTDYPKAELFPVDPLSERETDNEND